MNLNTLFEMGRLSTLGLLAAKVVFVLDHPDEQELPQAFKGSFEVAAELLVSVREADERVLANRVDLSEKAMHDISSLETMQKFFIQQLKIQDRQSMIALLQKTEELCRKANQNQADLAPGEREEIRKFFKDFSDFVGNAHDRLGG